MDEWKALPVVAAAEPALVRSYVALVAPVPVPQGPTRAREHIVGSGDGTMYRVTYPW